MSDFVGLLGAFAAGVAAWELFSRRDLIKILDRYEALVSRLIALLSEDNARAIEEITADLPRGRRP